MFYMPTNIQWGVKQHAPLLKTFGQRALIVTGKSSAQNGALSDMLEALDSQNMVVSVFDQTEENPSVENVLQATQLGLQFDAHMIIGIGGGSPLDAAKAVSLMVANPQLPAASMFTPEKKQHLPVIAIPTTAGTGSEVTPYAVITHHGQQTKITIPQALFPALALLDPQYMQHLPENITYSTTLDALSHLIESYLSARANPLSDEINEGGFRLFNQCQEALLHQDFTPELRKNLLLMSTMAGMAIAQTGTSLPHGLGYALTYHKQIPHGFANALVMQSYLRLCRNQSKVERMLTLCGFSHLDQLQQFIQQIIPLSLHLSAEEIEHFSQAMWNNKKKLACHPDPLTIEDIRAIYRNSIS